MATLEPALGALIPTGWGKGGGLSFLYVGIYLKMALLIQKGAI